MDKIRINFGKKLFVFEEKVELCLDLNKKVKPWQKQY